jgi:type IV pilus assembly protein PilW
MSAASELKILRGVAWPSSGDRGRQRGVTLLELMVAMLLGLLVSGGIVALFSATSRTNQVQTALSRVQENGRFAMGRMEADLRMAGAMYRQTTTVRNWSQSGNGALFPRASIVVNASGVTLNHLATDGRPPAGWAANEAYPLSASFFVRGYECSTGTCQPALPTGFPAQGNAVGNRVVGADVLTVSYLRGLGSVFTSAGTGAATVFTLPAGHNFQPGDLALFAGCSAPMLFRTAVAGNDISAVGLLQPAQFLPGSANAPCDSRIFNFTRDFITASYWLQLQPDTNPGADAGRLIPTLMRREGTDPAQEVAQGVERLDFLYGVSTMNNGTMMYLTANQLTSVLNDVRCSLPSPQFDRMQPALPTLPTYREPNCLWRSVRSIEVHGLFNTVDDVGVMSPQDMAYWYSIDGSAGPVIPGATMPVTGRPTHRMMRREFVSLVSTRNGSN